MDESRYVTCKIEIPPFVQEALIEFGRRLQADMLPQIQLAMAEMERRLAGIMADVAKAHPLRGVAPAEVDGVLPPPLL